MKSLLLGCALVLLGLPASAGLRIVTTTEDLAALARDVGGKHVKVQTIAKGYQDPHFVDAKPSYLLKLKRADLFIQIGLELESAWAPNLLRSARNKRIRLGSRGFLDASTGCDILDRNSDADRSQGDVHPEGNPHYWLDPANGRIIAGNIAARLSELDPDHAQDYKANLEAFTARLKGKMAEWTKLADTFRGRKVVTYHNSWPNFAKTFHLDVVDFVEPKPGIPAAPSHIKDLIERIRREKIALIFMEPYFDEKLPKKIAAETGAKLLILPPSVGAAKGVRTYIDLFDHNLRLLAESLGENR
jgi:zinc/manganese transport system substrate-binding protein